MSSAADPPYGALGMKKRNLLSPKITKEIAKRIRILDSTLELIIYNFLSFN